MPVANTGSPYLSVYQAVEEACSGQPLTVGLTGAMSRAIDRLRRMDAPRREIGLAERISIAMHRLDWAIRSGDAPAQQALRSELSSLGLDWLETPLCVH